jgi:hypothetical protein
LRPNGKKQPEYLRKLNNPSTSTWEKLRLKRKLAVKKMVVVNLMEFNIKNERLLSVIVCF